MFNKGKKPSPEHQHHPEYTQTSFLRIRSLEEAYNMENYFTNRTHSNGKSSDHKKNSIMKE